MADIVRRLQYAARDSFHNRRADLFIRLLCPQPGWRILDLGSGRGDPFSARIARRVDVSVTLADISDGPLYDAETYGFEAVILREGESLPFADHEFDAVVCNSVIEHATLPKEECLSLEIPEREWRARAFEAQQAFAAEIQRVGKRYFVQAPHKNFPLDLHLWLPCTNWLPHSATRRLVRWTDRYWVKKTGVSDWNLLGPRDMRRLFPGAQIHVERLWGLPKSIVAWAG